MTSLPLTPLESYFYHDDVPAHPCWQFGKFTWRGTLKRETLEKAWAEATARQPLWGAVVGPGPLGGLRWLLGRTAPAFHWGRAAADSEWPQWLPLDLSKGPGVRLYVQEGGTSTDVIICVHHAVCDGLAMLDVMEDTFALYAQALGAAAEPRPAPTLEALRERGRFGKGFLDSFWLSALQLAGIAAEWKLLRRTVAPLVPHTLVPDNAAMPAGWPCVISRRWSLEETNAARKAARVAKVSLAELCMRDLQAAIGSWRAAQGIVQPDAWIRLGTAISLRQKTSGSWPAANIFGITVIDRQEQSLHKRERLLRRAHEDMTLVQKWRLGYAFWMLLRMRRWWPGGIAAYARRRVVRMTFVMSYVGKLFAKAPFPRDGQHPAVPGAVLTAIQGFAPTRPGTAACLDLAVFVGQLDAHLNYDPRVITRPQAEALLGEFATQLSSSVVGN